MLFVCVLQEPPIPHIGRGASFYELHEVHIPAEEISSMKQSIFFVDLTFETTGIDPFPPGIFNDQLLV